MKATIQFSDEKLSSEEMLRTLNDATFVRKPEMIRALVPACVSLQIPVKMGMKLVAQTAALFWSVEHVFCNFEVGISPAPLLQLFGKTPLLIGSPLPVTMVTEYRKRRNRGPNNRRSKNSKSSQRSLIRSRSRCRRAHTYERIVTYRLG